MQRFNENELRLLASKEFNQILSADEKLGELENQKYNKNTTKLYNKIFTVKDATK